MDANPLEVYQASDGTTVINQTPLLPAQIATAFATVAEQYGEHGTRAMLAMSSWRDNPQAGRRVGSIINRDRFVDPISTMQRVRMARLALDDDIVGGAADLTESLALSAVSMSMPSDPAVESVWNQWAKLVNLDGVMRDCWLDLFSDSSTVVASWWERREFQVSGVGPAGLPRRKKFSLVVPTALSTMDSTRVVPVGTPLFGREVLAYVASTTEANEFDQLSGAAPLSGWRNRWRDEMPSLLPDDDIVRRLVRHRYYPGQQETRDLVEAGLSELDCRNLFVLDSRYVWRHTLTRSHQKFPRVRLKSVFELLDLKQNLRAKDRSFMIGATNYLVVLKQGDKDAKATPEELRALQAGAKNLAQFPVLVGDYRLSVDIVAPPTDMALKQEEHDVIDTRIAARVFGTFVSSGTEDSDPLKLGRVIGQSLESRRRMLRRSFEANILDRIVETNPQLGKSPKLKFSPAQISLAFDQAWASFLLDLREAREMSRETLLSQFGLDQAEEAGLREREADEFDDVFGTIVPHGHNPGGDTDDPAAPDGGRPSRLAKRQGGRRRGGTRNGGGAAPGSGQGEESRDPRRSKAEELTAAIEELASLKRPDLIAVAGELPAPVPMRHRMRAEDLRQAIAEQLEAQLDEDGFDGNS